MLKCEEEEEEARVGGRAAESGGGRPRRDKEEVLGVRRRPWLKWAAEIHRGEKKRERIRVFYAIGL